MSLGKIQNRKSITEELKRFNPFSKEGDFIEVIEWSNGEGYDIIIYSDGSTKWMSISYNELNAIQLLTQMLTYGSTENS